jgi:hypothetical protein
MAIADINSPNIFSASAGIGLVSLARAAASD